jgi:hypothetical protein
MTKWFHANHVAVDSIVLATDTIVKLTIKDKINSSVCMFLLFSTNANTTLNTVVNILNPLHVIFTYDLLNQLQH